MKVGNLMVAVVAMSLAGLGEARAADEKEECIAAHAHGQELRLSGKWTEAAKRFRACSAAACPTAVTQDCTRWSDELGAATPSILVAGVSPDGADTVDAALVVDGVRIAERLPTTSMELDPGEHTIRLEHAGWPPVAERIVVRERERNRAIRLRFREPEKPSPKSISVFGVVMTGVGVAALGLGVTFGVLGRTRETELADSPCGRTGTCDPDDVDLVRQRYWIGGIATGVGVVALAVGLYALLSPKGEPRRSGALPSVLFGYGGP